VSFAGNRYADCPTSIENAFHDYGPGVLYGNARVYVAPTSATPEEQFRTALNLLDANMARRAEPLIESAVEGGYRSNRVVYYWALAVLSGRSLDDLLPDDFDALQRCAAMADLANADSWLTALHVTVMFINCAMGQRPFQGADEELDRIIVEYGALEEGRRDEIRRHLDLLTTGVLKDSLDARYAREIAGRRMAGNRTERAWKFFEPDPEPPRLPQFDEPRFGGAGRVTAVLGAVAAGGALLLMLMTTITHDLVLGLAFAAGTGIGGYLVATVGRRWAVARVRIAADDARYDATPPAGRYSEGFEHTVDAVDDYAWGEDDKADEERISDLTRRNQFLLSVPWWIGEHLDGRNLVSLRSRVKWQEETRGLRAALASDILRRYGSSAPDVNRLSWLITWHAKRAKEQWETGTLRAHRSELQAAAPNGALPLLGLVAILGGISCSLIAAREGNVREIIVLLAILAFGSCIGYLSRFDVYVVRHDIYHAEMALAYSRHAEEQAEFDRWTAVLGDRPSDTEMARWLAYDKIHCAGLALNARGIANRDAMAHATVAEALRPCKRARVLFGTPRYSHYRVSVILLTDAGIVITSVKLDFLSGTISDLESMRELPVESIASARLIEVEVRFNGDDREVVTLDRHVDADSADGGAGSNSGSVGQLNGDKTAGHSAVLSQALRITLVPAGNIDFVMEPLDERFLDPAREDEATLFGQVVGDSGIRGAMRLLEDVAIEGRGWISSRRRHRITRGLDQPARQLQALSADLVEDELGTHADRGNSGSSDGGHPRDDAVASEDPRVRYLQGSLPERAPTGRRISLIVQIRLTRALASAPLKPLEVPSEGREVTIIVTAPGLVTLNDLEQELHVPAAADSEPIRFAFMAGRTGLHQVILRAFAGGTFLGELALEVSVEVGASLEEGSPRSALLDGLTAEPGEVTLQVSRTDEDRYSFQLIGEALYPVELTRRLAGDPTEVIGALAQELRAMAAQKSPYGNTALVRNRIRNLGAQLWADVVPETIRRQFWDLAGHIKLFTVASDMDTVPWELLYPIDGNNDNGFLVEQFPVVRRVYGQRRVRHLKLSSAAYIVPQGSPIIAMDEVQAVRARLGGIRDHGVCTRLDSLISLLDDSPSVLHFACHNAFTDAAGSVISLDGGPLRPSDLAVCVQARRMAGASPLVFFNACRTAGEISGMIQTMGWAKQFMGAGAGAFIGSLWAVRSSSAKSFADTFYHGMVTDGQTLGAASLRARQAIAADSGDPTWLAYSIYGNPAATLGQGSLQRASGGSQIQRRIRR
jgi:hypothetical protein